MFLILLFVKQIQPFKSCHVNKGYYSNYYVTKQSVHRNVRSHVIFQVPCWRNFNIPQLCSKCVPARVHVLFLKTTSPGWVNSSTIVWLEKRKWVNERVRAQTTDILKCATPMKILAIIGKRGRGGKTSESRKFTEHKNRGMLLALLSDTLQ